MRAYNPPMAAHRARSRMHLLGVALALATGGCAARPDRFAAARREAAATTVHGVQEGRSGYASFGARVRLRDDTPPLTPLVEAEQAARREAMLADAYARAAMRGASGPQGDEGSVDRAPVLYAPLYPAPGFVPVGAGYPYFVGPLGTLPPGLREPSSAVPVPGTFADVGHTSPWSDAYTHRPGLSTGSGIYARPNAR